MLVSDMQVIVSEEEPLATPETVESSHSRSHSHSHTMKLVTQIQNLLTISGGGGGGKEPPTAAAAATVAAANANVKCQSTNQTTNDCIPMPSEARVYFPGISQLLPSLYLCGAGVAMPHLLDQLGVSFIINVAPELPDTPLSSVSKPLYLRVDALDRPHVDLRQHFDEVADMIEQVRQNGGISLVHCVAGVSRSATLCLAYLIKHMGMSLRTAYYHVKAMRPEIRPNSGFFEQLRYYEQQIHGSSSVRMVFYESLNKEIPDVYETEYKAMELFYQRQRRALRNR